MSLITHVAVPRPTALPVARPAWLLVAAVRLIGLASGLIIWLTLATPAA